MAPHESIDDPVAGSPRDALVQRYLDHVRFEKRLAQRTVALYTLDLERLAAHAAQAGVSLTAVEPGHIRRPVRPPSCRVAPSGRGHRAMGIG